MGKLLYPKVFFSWKKYASYIDIIFLLKLTASFIWMHWKVYMFREETKSSTVPLYVHIFNKNFIAYVILKFALLT